jgi:hypothetical protein
MAMDSVRSVRCTGGCGTFQAMVLRDLLRVLSPSLSNDDAARAEARLIEMDATLTELVKQVAASPLAKDIAELAEAFRDAAGHLPEDFPALKDRNTKELQELFEERMHTKAYLYVPTLGPVALMQATEPEPIPPPTVVRGFRKDEE